MDILMVEHMHGIKVVGIELTTRNSCLLRWITVDARGDRECALTEI